MPGGNVYAYFREKDFGADEYQNDCQSRFEIFETADGFGKEKIQRAQAENSEDVAGINNKNILSNQKDGGDTVKCKDDIHQFDNYQRKKERRYVRVPVFNSEEMFAVETMSNFESAFNQTKEAAVAEIGVVFLDCQHFGAGIYQK